MGANGEHTPLYFATSSHSHLHRTLARPQSHRRDTKANLKRDSNINTSATLLSQAQLRASPGSPDPIVGTKKRIPSLSDTQLFPVDMSEFQAVNSMWTKQGRSQRGMELISGDLVGLQRTQAARTSGIMTILPDPTASFPSVSASVQSSTTAVVSMSPGTSSASSLPSAIFSSVASTSSTSSASAGTVVCRSSPCLGAPAGHSSKYLDAHCTCDACSLRQYHPSFKSEKPVSQSTALQLERLSLPKPSAIRTPVASSASPLHVLLDEARRDGICSAELAVRETSKLKVNPTKMYSTHPHSRMRSRSLSTDDEPKRSIGVAISSPSAPPSPRLPHKTSTLLDNFVSFTTKLPLSYDLSIDANASTGTSMDSISTTPRTDESYPLLPLHPYPTETYALKFPPPLPLPRSPFRARSPLRHPAPRFRLIENKEYLRLKAVWNRLSDADNVAVDLFVDTLHDGGDEGEEDEDGADYSHDEIGLHDIDCECECEDEYEYGEGDNCSSSGHRHTRSPQRSCTRRRILSSYPLPPQALVDKQGNLHTGCELIVGVAIDGLSGSALRPSLTRTSSGGRRRNEAVRDKARLAKGHNHHHRPHNGLATNKPRFTSSKLDLLDSLSFTGLVPSSSLSLSSLSSSVRKTLDSFRALGEGHARRVGVSAQVTTVTVSGDVGSAAGYKLAVSQTQASSHAQSFHRSISASLSGPEGL